MASSGRCRPGTSHDLGDHFGRVFDIRFLDRDGERKWAFNTSFGLSHRAVGATVMVHGDDAGLKLPPVVAPVQVDRHPDLADGWRSGDGEERPSSASRSGSRPWPACGSIGADDRTPGYKFNDTQYTACNAPLDRPRRNRAGGDGGGLDSTLETML